MDGEVGGGGESGTGGTRVDGLGGGGGLRPLEADLDLDLELELLLRGRAMMMIDALKDLSVNEVKLGVLCG